MPAEVTSARTRKTIPYPWLICSGVIMLLCLLLQTPVVSAYYNRDAQVQENLRASLDALQPSWITEFYRGADNTPVWLHPQRLAELSNLDQLAELHGLNPHDYALGDTTQQIYSAIYHNDARALSNLELKITQNLARLAVDLYLGKVNPQGSAATLRSHQDADRLSAAMLRDALNAGSLFAYLDSLPPDTLLYRRLLLSLRQHRALLDNDVERPFIPAGRTLQPGMHDSRVPALRVRLNVTDQHNPTLFDQTLAAAVGEFQTAHLLTSDGLVGNKTAEAMNVSIRERIDQLRVNLDLQRWAADTAQQDHLLVNVAHYQVHFVKNQRRIWSTRSQVGRAERPTPTFKSSITAITANPSWTVPPTIFREDMLPGLLSDPYFLSRKGLHVVNKRGQRVDATTINWWNTDPNNSRYRLRAQPGENNALGRLKFNVPNPYLIYLHDTPSKHLFQRDERNFSSGCIRLEEPRQLAALLIDYQRELEREQLQSALAQTRTRHLNLDNPVPLIVLYATADLDSAGELVFAADVYGKDRRILVALNSVPASRPEGIRLANADAAPTTH